MSEDGVYFVAMMVTLSFAIIVPIMVLLEVYK